MKFPQILFSTVLFFFACTCIYAQVESSKNPSKSKEQIQLEEKALRLLKDTIDESARLKLPENRILVFSIAGDLLWNRDEKFARSLIQNAANDFIQLQNAVKDNSQSELPNYRFYISNNLRGQMIYSLLSKDAEFALEIFYSTRSPEIADAVLLYQQIITNTGKNPDLSKVKPGDINKLQIAKQEIETEQKIKREIAIDDPQKLSENIRESFAKDLGSYQMLFDLEKLNKKNHDLAQKLLNEIMSKLARSDFSDGSERSHLTFFIYARFLNLGRQNTDSDGKNEKLNFEEISVKAIANNELDYFIKSKSLRDPGNSIQKIAYLKEILPERVGEIEKLYEVVKQSGGNAEWVESIIASSKLGENPRLEEIIKNSSKLSSNHRENFYRIAVSKLFETESVEKIAQKLRQIPDVEEREKALDYLKSLVIGKNNEQNNLSDVLNDVNQIKSEKERISKFVSLAVSHHQKKTEESQKNADQLMREAEKLVKLVPETATEYEAIVPIIWGYSKIGSPRAFDLLEPLVQQTNRIINAYILFMSFNDKNYPYVSEGEINFASQNGYKSIDQRYKEIAKMLAQIDFERAEKIIENLGRSDVKIMVKLLLAESILENQ